MLSWLRRKTATLDHAGGGLVVDVALYLLSAAFAGATIASTLGPHRAWGAVAVWGYIAGAALAIGQLVAHTRAGAHRPRITSTTARGIIAVAVWCATVVVPLLLQATQRSSGHSGRAQEEVLVIEDGGRRLLDTGTPYLSRAAIAALPADDRLLGYLPYQPGMTLFGIPRALDPSGAWWSDARVWFAIVTMGALIAALVLLRRAGAAPGALVRGLQVATVLPLCALTLVTGGDDMPVLALCLLALALAATDRWGGAGVAVGAAAALKLFAWPVAIVLAVYAVTRARARGSHASLTRFAIGAVGIPLLTLLPIAALDPGAVVENVIAFPTGQGLVTSPARSPLPGYLIASWLPDGRALVLILLALAAGRIGRHLVRRPPATATATSVICGVGLLVGLLLLPSTRFGYLLYPAAFLVWAPALRVSPPTLEANSPKRTAPIMNRSS